MIAPALLVWWLRPVRSATRVGEHSAVVWKRLYFSPWLASRSSVGIGIGAAERARVAEADVVDQEDDDVRRALRRLHLEARRRLGVARVELGGQRVVRLRDRQHRAVDAARGRGAGAAVCCGSGALQPVTPASASARGRRARKYCDTRLMITLQWRQIVATCQIVDAVPQHGPIAFRLRTVLAAHHDLIDLARVVEDVFHLGPGLHPLVGGVELPPQPVRRAVQIAERIVQLVFLLARDGFLRLGRRAAARAARPFRRLRVVLPCSALLSAHLRNSSTPSSTLRMRSATWTFVNATCATRVRSWPGTRGWPRPGISSLSFRNLHSLQLHAGNREGRGDDQGLPLCLQPRPDSQR